MKNLSLTFDQGKAIKAFELWLEKTSLTDPFILKGCAGTGKTFLSIKFLELVENRKLCWTVVAPTHKAVGVLRRSMSRANLKPTFYPSTIHRLLRLKLKRQGDTEACEQTPQTMKSLEQLKLVLVDEASMISSTLLEIILQCAHTYKTRLVFVGDPAQLPPIGEVQSPVFSIKKAAHIQLNEVVRHQGPVLKLATLLRDESFLCPSPPCFPVVANTQCCIGSLDHKEWLEKAKDSLYSASKKDDPDAARILCYTNRFLERLIPHARRAIHGAIADEMSVLPGEVLISRRAVMSNASLEQFSTEEEPGMLFGSNTEMIVKEVSEELNDFGNSEFADQGLIDFPQMKILTAKVSCRGSEFLVRLMPEVGSSSRATLDCFLEDLASKARQASSKEARKLWKMFFYFRDSFAYLCPASVLTVHRSQGSTFGEVFVASDVFWPNDISLRRQLAYVAVSRANKGVWLLGSNDKLHKRDIWEREIDLIHQDMTN
ncbi:AAA family ATPase [Prochlorococcus marinus]|uniref:Exodeoxyribonuclease V n=1 Tax=Prochlorococcus marinus (strain MIT 9211) TaxID=93059 RepID=A9BB36_PROM4|nr:AAA family ATPase [Prochlorococcus marinus]ABX09048.1 Exodeoxyribonuclease V [Prochlorococcus marinus str. MIT 9211]